jgi:hypothetical protein
LGGVLRVIPKIGLIDLFFQLSNLAPLGFQVKVHHPVLSGVPKVRGLGQRWC